MRITTAVTGTARSSPRLIDSKRGGVVEFQSIAKRTFPAPKILARTPGLATVRILWELADPPGAGSRRPPAVDLNLSRYTFRRRCYSYPRRDLGAPAIILPAPFDDFHRGTHARRLFCAFLEFLSLAKVEAQISAIGSELATRLVLDCPLYSALLTNLIHT